MVSEEHITAFGWATPAGNRRHHGRWLYAFNDFLTGLFLGIGIRLVDFKMECGRLFENEMMRIIVADEISPRFRAGCGTSSRTKSSTRTASAGISVASWRAYTESRQAVGQS